MICYGERGFVGALPIKNLILEGGHAVRVIDNLSVGTRKGLESVTESCQLVVCDLRDREQAVKAAKKTPIFSLTLKARKLLADSYRPLSVTAFEKPLAAL